MTDYRPDIIGGPIFPDTYEYCALISHPSRGLAKRLAQRALAHPADYQSLSERLRADVEALLRRAEMFDVLAQIRAFHTDPAPPACASACPPNADPTTPHPAAPQEPAHALPAKEKASDLPLSSSGENSHRTGGQA